MKVIRAEHLISRIVQAVGITQMSDIELLLLEEVYSYLTSLPWSWNWHEGGGATFAPVVGSKTTYTWAKGTNYLQSSSAGFGGFNYTHTGRVFLLDQRKYRVVEFDVTNWRIVLDRTLTIEELEETEITLYRDMICFPTSFMRGLWTDIKLDSSTLNDVGRDRVGRFRCWSTGAPHKYIGTTSYEIPAPRQPPFVSGAVGGTVPAGRYRYFFTYYDAESGIESSPGPVLQYDNASAQDITLQYGTTNIGELSYTLRLYRSEVEPETERPPMFLLYEKDPTDVLDVIVDNNLSDTMFFGLEQYYDGTWTTCYYVNIPDDCYQLDWIHTNQFGFRIHEEQNLRLGTTDEVIQAIELFFMRIKSAGVNGVSTEDYRRQIIAYRSQLNFLITSDREPTHSDPGSSKRRALPISPLADDEDNNNISSTWRADF